MAVVTMAVGLWFFLHAAGGPASAPSPQVEPPVELFELLVNRSRSVRAYGDLASARLPPLPDVAPAALRSLGRAVPIGEAHSRGLLHRGVWLFVLDARRRVLVLRRSPSTVTCPSAWSLVGEHSERAETWVAGARRALVEELGVASAVAASIPITPLGLPVLFSCDYGRTGGGAKPKLDLQATALLAVALPAGVERGLAFDADVADHRWLSLSALERLARSEGAELQFCNARIRALLGLAISRLKAASPDGDVASRQVRKLAGLEEAAAPGDAYSPVDAHAPATTLAPRQRTQPPGVQAAARPTRRLPAR